MPRSGRLAGGSRRVAAGSAAALFTAALGLGGCGRVVIDGATGGEGGGTTAPPCLCADEGCPADMHCVDCACVACGPGLPCKNGLSCCGDACVDLASDPASCGACGAACEAPGATMKCEGGECAIAACDAGFADCDEDPANGCEVSGSECLCAPGQELPCYTGPDGTAGVGACTTGIHECVNGVQWGPCEGEVVPTAETCNGVDDDCDGLDDDWDGDGDGWTACGGDCCDSLDCSAHPELVNPGAIEHPGNGQDDDCNPATLDTDPYAVCNEPPLSVPTTALALARAMDLCTLTAEESETWGLISATLALADGSAAVLPDDLQLGVLADYGPHVAPQYGATMAALSTGTARDEGDPGHVYPQHGAAGQIGNFNAGTQAPIPPAFLSANGGKVPTACGACDEPACGTAFDSVNLRLRMRAPTNVQGFSYRFKFYTAEYPENVCEKFNDFFVALIDSKHPNIPADRNVAYESQGNPVSVDNAFFDVCVSPGLCPAGSLELVGTGMGGWDGLLHGGAGTSWLQDEVPVVPGEIIELQLIVWDAIDGNVDSLVLLDRFRWLPPSAL